ncbi:MAG TPA: AsmA-like C-terminal region-containing protein [Chitinophagales bacterium]|nr:AsmA-like C-terminal region-containing protein [Chitinophagales bacterium]
MKKFLIAIAIIFFLIIAAAILLPILFKDKIIAKAKDEINKSVNAKVNFGKFDLTIIKSFPNLTFCLNDFSILGINEFEGDTLAYIKELDVKLNIWDVIGGSQMKIISISLDKPYINILVLKDGKANYDITKPSAASSSGSTGNFKLAVQSYSLHQGRIVYDDQSLPLKLTMENVDHSGSGDFTQDLFTLSTKTTVEKTSVWYGAVKYLSNAKTKLDADLDVDMKNSKYTFKQNELALNELILGFDGWVAMPGNDINMDLKWDVKKNDFRNFVSMVPGVYTASFKDLKSSGKLTLNGFVKGTYNEKKIPAYGLNLKIDNGMFQYPSLPTAVNKVHVDLNVNNPDGVTDHTVINLKQLHAEFGTEPFDARLYVTTPVSDANIDAMMKGTVNLANIKNIIPLEKGTDLNGIIKADMTMKGRYSAIEQKQYQNFNAAGTLGVSNMNYKSTDYPLTTINNLLLTFNPQNVTLNQLDAHLGKSDFKATGSIDNLLGYYFKKELLKGTFSLNSTLLDLNELMSGNSTSAAAPDTSKMSVIEVPANVDFTINTAIGKILYEDLVLEKVSGKAEIHDQKIDLSNLAFNMLNGNVNMSGTYATTNPKKPAFDYNLSLQHFDIQQTVKTFTTVQKMAPIAKRCSGNFSSDLIVKGEMDEHMQPVMNSLAGKGKLMSQYLTVSNFEPLNKLADALKMDEYKKLDIADLNLSFEFKDGRVIASPFTTQFHGATATISGSNGFDETIDYTVNLAIPKSKIPASATSLMTNGLAKANNLVGTNFQLPDPLKVNVLIGGTVMKPAIKTDFSKQGQSIVSTVKEEVKQQVQQQIDNGKQQAREQADKILADADKQAQAIRDAAKSSADQAKKQGYAAADKLVAQATNPIAKAAAQQAAKKAKAETDKRAQQIIDEGNKKAQLVLDEAKKKSDALLK